MRLKTAVLGFLFMLGGSATVFAGPWFTGPIFAPAGHTIPKGHTNFEMYGLDIYTRGRYTDTGQIVRFPVIMTTVANPILTHGFTDWFDVQLGIPYLFNATRDIAFNRLGDVSVAAGFQLAEQKQNRGLPDIRLMFAETVPTGRFEDLIPELAGMDSTGYGTYQNQITLNFQHVKTLFQTHYLRTRLALSAYHFSPVHIHGFNSYGGDATTDGVIEAGAEWDADLAFEYTVTQNWVAVMEGYISKGQSTRFHNNNAVKTETGDQVVIGNGSYREIVLAPAIEYNFSGNIGVIGGVWFPVNGKNTSKYLGYCLALNAYW